jgi:hypothetical protein
MNYLSKESKEQQAQSWALWEMERRRRSLLLESNSLPRFSRIQERKKGNNLISLKKFSIQNVQDIQ